MQITAREKESRESRYPRFASTLIALEDTEFDYRMSSISAKEGERIWECIRKNGFRRTIEIGCALGVSSLYICDATSVFLNSSHTIIDPYETRDWGGIGVRNLEARGIDFALLIEQPSELALPGLLEKGAEFDFAFIDGWHTFDHSLVDFFYLNRLIRVGGGDRVRRCEDAIARKAPQLRLQLSSLQDDYSGDRGAQHSNVARASLQCPSPVRKNRPAFGQY